MLSVAGLLCLLVAGAECWGAAVKVVTSAMDTQGQVHGIMGRRFPDGGLLRYRK